ncbi:MAG: MazG nucleotide pyrophosphohydrolase domain-containing protein [Parvularculaceae bacterium]
MPRRGHRPARRCASWPAGDDPRSKTSKRAARVGFDWTNPRDVLAKIAEETGELVEAMDGGDKDRIEDEYGDLLFVMANLSRHLDIDPEAAVRRANEKFRRRFAHIEESLAATGRVERRKP